MKFWNFKKTENDEIELRISGDIIDDDYAWLYEWFKNDYASPNSFRNELAKYKDKDLTIWIDSYGGSCFAAAGIYNALKEHKGKKRVRIDGKAMSAATVIAMAGDVIEMTPVSIFMIHNPLTYAEGYASDLRKTAEVLDVVKDTIVNAYQIKTGRNRADISKMMDEETYMSPQKALEEGFIDGIIYADGESQKNIFNGFSRNQILNSATSDAIKRIIEMERESKEEPAPLVNEIISDKQKANVLKYLKMEEQINE